MFIKHEYLQPKRLNTLISVDFFRLIRIKEETFVLIKKKWYEDLRPWSTTN